MSKRGRATYTARSHGNPNSKIHARDKLSQQERKARHAKGRFVFTEDRQEGQVYPAFESNFPGFGDGFCWQVKRDEKGKVTGIEPVEGETWERALADQTASLSWYHQWQVRKDKESWKKRKIKDRAKLTARDRRERADSDVERATFELRPDHSRAVQYLSPVTTTASDRDALNARSKEKNIPLIQTMQEPSINKLNNSLWSQHRQRNPESENQTLASRSNNGRATARLFCLLLLQKIKNQGLQDSSNPIHNRHNLARLGSF